MNKSIEIVINAQDQWLYQGEIHDADKLEQVLSDDLAKLEDKRVRIRGDRVADLGSAVSLLDLARKAGATGIDIVTEKR